MCVSNCTGCIEVIIAKPIPQSRLNTKRSSRCGNGIEPFCIPAAQIYQPSFNRIISRCLQQWVKTIGLPFFSLCRNSGRLLSAGTNAICSAACLLNRDNEGSCGPAPDYPFYDNRLFLPSAKAVALLNPRIQPAFLFEPS